MTRRIGYRGARIFDGRSWWENSTLIVAGGLIEDIAADHVARSSELVSLSGGTIAPGLIDLQVNGGGGVQLNRTPDVATIEAICATGMRFGTTACLPTFITDTPERVAMVLAAGAEAARRGVAGFLGLHIEGPHLAIRRKGAHDPVLIRPMDDADLARLIEARQNLPHLLTTVAAEVVTPPQISRLVQGGLVVGIGHSDATYDQVRAAVEAGATVVTHLFNAQSPLGSRDPGVVGAALDIGGLHAGLIADGVHVHPASIRVALAAKRPPGHLILVTDAMAVTGTSLASFELTGRMVYRRNGALRLVDGALAGADLTLPEALRFMRDAVGASIDEAFRMASLYPAQLLGVAHERGVLSRGARADFAHFDNELNLLECFVAGGSVWHRQ